MTPKKSYAFEGRCTAVNLRGPPKSSEPALARMDAATLPWRSPGIGALAKLELMAMLIFLIEVTWPLFGSRASVQPWLSAAVRADGISKLDGKYALR